MTVLCRDQGRKERKMEGERTRAVRRCEGEDRIEGRGGGGEYKRAIESLVG